MNELHTPAVDEAVAADEKGVGWFAGERCKRRVDFLAAAGADKLDLQSHGAGSGWRASFYGLGIRNIGRIDKNGDAGSSGHQLMQQLQLLRHQFGVEKIDTRQVSARTGEARDETEPHGVVADDEHDRDCRCCCFYIEYGGSASTREYHSDLSTNQ